jgi:hypothetical protein
MAAAAAITTVTAGSSSESGPAAPLAGWRPPVAPRLPPPPPLLEALQPPVAAGDDEEQSPPPLRQRHGRSGGRHSRIDSAGSATTAAALTPTPTAVAAAVRAARAVAATDAGAVAVQAQLPAWEPGGDMTALLTRFGYVALFACAYPLAPLVAVASAMGEAAADAAKLCTTYRRPLPRCHGSGGGSVVRPWLPAFEAVSYCAVVTNCALMALAARGNLGGGGGGGALAWLARGWGGGSDDTRLLLAAVALEHALLAVKLLLSRALPA